MKQEFKLASQEIVFTALGSLLTFITLCHMSLILLINKHNVALHLLCSSEK